MTKAAARVTLTAAFSFYRCSSSHVMPTPGPRAQPSRSLAFPHTVSVVLTFVLNDTLPPHALMADKDPPSLTLPEDYIPRRRFASSRGTKRSIYDRFAEDLFPKKNIHFISNYLPDSKRQQTTTVDYKRLFNGLVLTRVTSLQR